jgi:hypothetical protein
MDKAECDHPERILTAEALRCHGITFAEEIKALKYVNQFPPVNFNNLPTKDFKLAGTRKCFVRGTFDV